MSDTQQVQVQQVTEQVLDTVRTVQSAAVSSIGFWAQTTQSLAMQNPVAWANSWANPWANRLPEPSAVLDDVYDAVEKVVANQREFGHQLVAAVKPVVEAVAEAVPAVGATTKPAAAAKKK